MDWELKRFSVGVFGLKFVFEPQPRQPIYDGAEKSWIDKINRLFPQHFRTYQVLHAPPSLRSLGRIGAKENPNVPWLSSNGEVVLDDPFAVIDDEQVKLLGDTPLSLSYKFGYYSEIQPKRNSGEKPHGITANILAVLPNDRKLVLQRRSGDSDLFPFQKSIFGGGFMPGGLKGRYEDHDNIKLTAIREFHEETGFSFSIRQKSMDCCPIIVTQELDTGNIQINFLGVQVDQLLEIKGSSWEGTVFFIPSDSLEKELKFNNWPNWTRLGLISIITWLHLNAPGFPKGTKFGKYKPQQLAMSISDLGA